MRRCAFLTLGALTHDDALVVEPLASRGWQVDAVDWREPAHWRHYQRVVIRSTWDYQERPQRFVDLLAQIAACTRLDNALSLVRWNLDKRYLAELARRRIPVVPTVWCGRLTIEALQPHEAPVIVKPVVSASAQRTYRVAPGTDKGRLAEIVRAFGDDAAMIQPLVRNVLAEGEYSLVFFNGVFSHAVLKKPADGDFRVQAEHGGQLRAVNVDRGLLGSARQVLAQLPQLPLYARVDLVRADTGPGYWLMELELIEPSLLLRFATDAASRFAAAFDAGPEIQ